MINVTLPTGMGLRDWADQIVLNLTQYGVFGRLINEDGWQDWAVQFLNNSTLGGALPNPYGFLNWQDWAERFCQSLN